MSFLQTAFLLFTFLVKSVFAFLVKAIPSIIYHTISKKYRVICQIYNSITAMYGSKYTM